MADVKYFADLTALPVPNDGNIMAFQEDPIGSTGYKTTALQLKNYVNSGVGVTHESLTISSDGQVSFTLASAPSNPTDSILTLNGQTRQYGASDDYTISGTTLTWNDPGGLTLKTTDNFQIWYDVNLLSLSAVSSVFGRTGAVVAQAGDYTVAQVTGAAASGANSDITSLSGLTTALSIAQGGTNSTTALANGKVMQSSAGKIVESSVDISSLGGNVTVFFKPETNTNEGNHRVRSLAGTANFNFEFAIPGDFSSLVSLEMIMTPSAGAAGTGKDVDLSSNYGAIGEPNNQHSETDTTSTYNFGTAGVFAALDVSSVFTSLSAGDICGLNWDNNSVGGTTFHYYIKLVYTR